MDHFILWSTLSVIVALAMTGVYLLFAMGQQNRTCEESQQAATVANRDRILRGTGIGMVAVPVIVVAAFMLMRAADLSPSLLSVWTVGLTTAILGALSVASAVATITSRTSGEAITFFSLMLLANAGLLLLANAQFLSVATAIVYASLCVLGSLFVIRCGPDQELSQSMHKPLLGCISGSLLAIGLIGTSHLGAIAANAAKSQPPGTDVLALASRSGFLRSDQFSFTELGLTLFRDHWLGVELAGAIMLLALVGASWVLRSGGDPQAALCPPVDRGVGCETIRQEAESE